MALAGKPVEAKGLPIKKGNVPPSSTMCCASAGDAVRNEKHPTVTNNLRRVITCSLLSGRMARPSGSRLSIPITNSRGTITPRRLEQRRHLPDLHRAEQHCAVAKAE